MLDPAAYGRLDGGAAVTDVVDLTSLSRLGDQLLGMGTTVVAIKLGEQGLYVRTSGVPARVRDFCDRLSLNAGRVVRSRGRVAVLPGAARRRDDRRGRLHDRRLSRSAAARRRTGAGGDQRDGGRRVERRSARRDQRRPAVARARRSGPRRVGPSSDPDPSRRPRARARRSRHPHAQSTRQGTGMKSLDAKLASIHADPAARPTSSSPTPRTPTWPPASRRRAPIRVTGKPRSLAEYRDQMREIVRQGLVDIMLMSRQHQRRPDDPGAAVRRLARHARRPRQRHDRHPRRRRRGPTRRRRRGRSARRRSSRSSAATLDPTPRRAAGAAPTSASTRSRSTTTSRSTTPRSRPTRSSASRPSARASATSSRSSTRTSAGPQRPDGHRPLHQRRDRPHARRRAAARAGRSSSRSPTTGRKAMEELVAYDPHLVVGILGGSGGTTYDAFKLLDDAKKYGARAALFGRKINNTEHQLTFVRFLRAIADGQIDAGGGGAGLSRRPGQAGDQAAPPAGRGPAADRHQRRLRGRSAQIGCSRGRITRSRIVTCRGRVSM